VKADSATSEAAESTTESASEAAAAADAGKRSRGRKGKSSKSEGPFEVTLVHARNTHLGWAIVALAVGVLLVWKLAIVGQALGVISLVFAAFAARSFAMTLLNPPGTIRVEDDRVELPVGLCRGKSDALPYEQIKHVFFLRRAVPWTRAGPVLVVETADLAFTYPRDWFSSESEQRRVLRGIHRKLRRPE
jgi:hypothetical protein